MRHTAWMILAAGLITVACDTRADAFYCGAASCKLLPLTIL